MKFFRCVLCSVVVLSLLFIVNHTTTRADGSTGPYCVVEESDLGRSPNVLIDPQTQTTTSIREVPPNPDIFDTYKVYGEKHFLQSVSPNGKYFAYLVLSDDVIKRKHGEGDLVVTSTENASVFRYPVGLFIDIDGLFSRLTWSHQGDKLIFDGNNHLYIFDHSENRWQQHSYTVFDTSKTISTGLEWSADDAYYGFDVEKVGTSLGSISSFLNLSDFTVSSLPVGPIEPVWSPQGHQLAYVSRDNLANTTTGLKIFVHEPASLTKIVIDDVWTPPGSYGAYLAWTLDGSAITYFRKSGNIGALVRTTLPTLASETLISNIVGEPDYPQGSNPPLIIPWRQADGRLLVDLIKANGTDHVRVMDMGDNVQDIELPTMFYDPYPNLTDYRVSTDKNYVAFAWTARDQSQLVYLTWVRIDGTDRHDLKITYQAIDSIDWSDDGRLLFYKAHTENGVAVGMVDTATNTPHTLADGLLDTVYHDTIDVSTPYGYSHDDGNQSVFQSWVLTKTGILRLELFRIDGSETNHYDLVGRFADLSNFRAAVGYLPDGPPILFEVKTGNTHTLQLAYPNTMKVLLSSVNDIGLVGYGGWSPDGQTLAFTYRFRSQTDEILVFANRDGQILWQDNHYIAEDHILDWRECRIF